MNNDRVLSIARGVLGMRLVDARAMIVTNGMLVRVISEDGIQYAGTEGFLPHRINLEVIDGIVRETRVG